LLADEIRIATESHVESVLELRITDVVGRVWKNTTYRLPLGKQIMTIPLDFLPPGTFFIEGRHADNQEPFLMQFVKVH
jgi:hypothetical protein